MKSCTPNPIFSKLPGTVTLLWYKTITLNYTDALIFFPLLNTLGCCQAIQVSVYVDKWSSGSIIKKLAAITMFIVRSALDIIVLRILSWDNYLWTKCHCNFRFTECFKCLNIRLNPSRKISSSFGSPRKREERRQCCSPVHIVMLGRYELYVHQICQLHVGIEQDTVLLQK